MVVLARFFNWRQALVIVKPDTFIKWHRTAFRIFWRWKSGKCGRPPLPRNVKELIREMARENPTWGEERIADELQVKLGLNRTKILYHSASSWQFQPELENLRAEPGQSHRRL
jgi:putative transposase